MKFDCHISPQICFYILPTLQTCGIVRNIYHETIRKTVCFYGEKFNAYIDCSDGIANDFNRPEYCERIKRIVQDANGKPFLFFKNWYSPTLCRPIEAVANANGGKVVPFFYWSYQNWSGLPHRSILRAISATTPKTTDIGMCAKIHEYSIPKSSQFDSSCSWKGYEWFKLGPAQDTGEIRHDARISLHEQFTNSNLEYQHLSGVPFSDYIFNSFKWKAVIDPPGIACVSHRMLNHGWLGQCVILKKNDVDFAYSWKEYYPQVDFSSPNWEEDMGNILENHRLYGERILYYLETFCNPEVITAYLIEQMHKFEASL
jgi:hypothetical protein